MLSIYSKNVINSHFITFLYFILKSLSSFYKLIVLCIIFYVFLQPNLLAQQKTSAWKTLGKVTMKTRQEKGYSVEYPTFSAEVKALDGKMILLRGYILPLDLDNPKQFIFSLYPYNTCYFCGAAGPETVIQTQSKDKIPYVDKPVWIKGFLHLNADDPNQLMYRLEDATLAD